MKSKVIIIVIISLAIGFGVGWLVVSQFSAEPSEKELPDLVAEVSDSVVDVVAEEDLEILQNIFFTDEKNLVNSYDISSGTGFFVRQDGLIATCAHLLNGESYSIILKNGDRKKASVIYRSDIADIAFLDIEGDGYRVADFSDSSDLQPGQPVFAIGNSLGQYSHSIMAGNIAGLSREVIKDGVTYPDLFQIDMSVSNGDSGGPVFSAEGGIVGMITVYDARGNDISFAIPVNKIQQLLNEI